MNYRKFGRLGWNVSSIGYGMWGMAGWTGSDDEQSLQSLQAAVERGVNFFDTAWAYGEGHSEKLLGQLVRDNPDKKLYVASKIPPKNRQWPARAHYGLENVFPPEHLREYTEKSLENLGLDSLDLMQLHVWSDDWAEQESWQEAMRSLKDEGLVTAWGISVNRWEPDNVIRALETGLIDAVQVIYNVFDQNPEDKLFPVCQELGVAVIARVPFDEGSLTGTLTKDSSWPEGDWRNRYFTKENLEATLTRVEELKTLVPEGMTLAEMALRFILEHPAVSTAIPGMRQLRHVEANTRVSDAERLPSDLMKKLQEHRWERKPAPWSD